MYVARLIERCAPSMAASMAGYALSPSTSGDNLISYQQRSLGQVFDQVHLPQEMASVAPQLPDVLFRRGMFQRRRFRFRLAGAPSSSPADECD